MKMVRRSFGTIHTGHLPEEFEGDIEDYFHTLKESWDWTDYSAGVFALEIGAATERKHIQFYVEHSRKRPTTLAKDFGLTTAAVFDIVRDAKGAWDYCSGTGTHEGKHAIARFTFGTPKLHGDTQKADLKMMVGFILDGMTPYEIMQSHPYAYCVHRSRIWNFYNDVHESSQYQELSDRVGDPLIGFKQD